MAGFNAAHDGERHVYPGCNCFHSLQADCAAGYGFSAGRINRADIDIVGAGGPRGKRFLKIMGGVADDKAGAEFFCRFQRQVILSQMNAVGVNRHQLVKNAVLVVANTPSTLRSVATAANKR